MNLILELHEKARRAEKRIVLPESQDPRVVQAAARWAAKPRPRTCSARGCRSSGSSAGSRPSARAS
ncbi:MAG: hypothetical protein IPJ77_14415 [Planctomycetes bacterium]|nr:hypothetical protein [Planctomycetota bacterium]